MSRGNRGFVEATIRSTPTGIPAVDGSLEPRMVSARHSVVELATGTRGPIFNRAMHGRSGERTDGGAADRWTKLSLAESAR